MTLKHDLRPATRKAPWQVCGVRWLLDEAGDMRAEFFDAIEQVHGPVSGDKVALAALKHLGLEISGEAVRRHRRQGCRCPR